MAQDTTRKVGRPALAPEVSQIPAVTVPVQLHDAVIAEALYRDVSVARVVREALIYHLKNGPSSELHRK